MREEVLAWFFDALCMVEAPYFRPATINHPEGIVRERVFCYELYHQLRVLQSRRPSVTAFVLHGEMDKSGHPNFPGFGKKPDFVFHSPGTMENNTCVIEVKGNLVPEDIRKDFTNLLAFLGRYNYNFGLFILFGHRYQELRAICLQWFETLDFLHYAERIDILIIENLGVPPYRTTLYDLVQEPANAN